MESLQNWQNNFEGFANLATGPLGINKMWNIYFDIQLTDLKDADLGITAEYLPKFLENADVEDLSTLATLFEESSLFIEEHNQVCAKIVEVLNKYNEDSRIGATI